MYFNFVMETYMLFLISNEYKQHIYQNAFNEEKQYVYRKVYNDYKNICVHGKIRKHLLQIPRCLDLWYFSNDISMLVPVHRYWYQYSATGISIMFL